MLWVLVLVLGGAWLVDGVPVQRVVAMGFVLCVDPEGRKVRDIGVFVRLLIGAVVNDGDGGG